MKNVAPGSVLPRDLPKGEKKGTSRAHVKVLLNPKMKNGTPNEGHEA